MRALFIAVGSELLHQDRPDTNSLYVQKRLREYGILTDMKVVVGDQREHLVWLLKKAAPRFQLVLICGGLGPTEDDITRECVAGAFDLELQFDEAIWSEINELFRRRGCRPAENNARQAFVIKGAEVLVNPNGTAPGLFLQAGDCRIIILPGPPGELIPIFEKVLVEKIASLANYFIHKRRLVFGGIGESDLDQVAAPIYCKYKNPVTTVLASLGIVEIHLLGRDRRDPDKTLRLIEELAEKLKTELAPFFLFEGEHGLEEHLVERLLQSGMSLAVAESCSGGALGRRITSVPGCSAVFRGGVIAYADEIKKKLLGVPEEILRAQGAVSAEVANLMAQGVRQLCQADLGLAITGIAGPGGATPGKPVGLVFLHLAGPQSGQAARFVFPGDRAAVRERAVNTGLAMILRYLQGKNGS